MKDLLIRLGVNAVAIWLTSLMAQALGLPLRITTVAGALLAVLALSIANVLVRPILSLLALPLRCATFGLIGFVINAIIFWGVSLLNIPGFQVGNPKHPNVLATVEAAFFGSIVMGIVGAVLNSFVKTRN